MFKIHPAAMAILLTAGSAAALPSTPASSDFVPSETQIEEAVKRVIMENPELILQSLQRHDLETKQNAREEALVRLDGIIADDRYPRLGNAQSEPVGALFLDFNCGHCRRTHPEISEWLEQNQDKSLLVIDLPILGNGSVAAAAVSLAAYEQGNYRQVSDALFTSAGPLENLDVIGKTLTDAGIDAAPLLARASEPRLLQTLNDNVQLAQDLGINGTPALVIGDEMVLGAFSSEELEAAYQKSAQGE